MLHRSFLTIGLIFGLMAALGACRPEQAFEGAFEGTMGDSYDYGSLMLPLSPVPAGSIAVAVIDERPYVVNGDENPSYVGTVAGRYRNTVDVKTASERPLADIVADAIAEAYRRHGITATAVPAPEEGGLAAALSAAAASGADRLLVVRIGEWQTNAVVRVEEAWQFEATVHDAAGELLGLRASQGRSNVGTAGFDEESAEMAVAALSRRLAYLLNDPQITGALGGA